ncbi:hypothetical protein LZK75_10020 [Rhizobium leguminosarum]|nr:hypothetical protein LZK75_10020 [Rhizobium leguminosarum]
MGWTPEYPVVAIYANNGVFRGEGAFLFVPRWIGLACAVALFLLGHLIIWRLTINSTAGFQETWKGGSIGKFAAAWFSNSAGMPSLSMFQIYLWTWVLICGLTYVVVQTGELFALSPQVLWILGIAGAGSLTARFLTTPTIELPAGTEVKFSDILRTGGRLDLYRLQIFLFTLYTAIYVTVRIVVDQAFPYLEENLLLLMGISNGLYVGSKVASESPADAVTRLKMNLADATKSQNEKKVQVESLKKVIQDLRAKGEPVEIVNAKENELANEEALLTASEKSVQSIASELKAAQDRVSKG